MLVVDPLRMGFLMDDERIARLFLDREDLDSCDHMYGVAGIGRFIVL